MGEVTDALVLASKNPHEPPKIFVVGPQADVARYVAKLVRTFGMPESSFTSQPKDTSLATESFVQHLIDFYRDKKELLRYVVALKHDGQDKYLAKLVESCPTLTVYVVTEGGKEGLRQVFLDSDGNILEIELPSPKAEQSCFHGNVPADAMYGKALEYAKLLDTPLGFAYLSILAAACAHGIEDSDGVRATIFAEQLGKRGCGKSLSKNRSLELFFGPKWMDDERIVYQVIASDIGLYLSLGQEGKPRLLAQDEFRATLAKGNIDKSALMYVLSDLFNSDKAGNRVKKDSQDVNARLSILGCIAMASPAEFPVVHGYQSAQGFCDRCFIGVHPELNGWRSSWTWQVPPIDFKPSRPRFELWVEQEVNLWADAKPESRNLRMRELAMRLILITSAINEDVFITKECVAAALKFMEWQEKVRLVYRAAEAIRLDEQFVIEVERAFKESNWVMDFRAAIRSNNWSRTFAGRVSALKADLVKQGMMTRIKVPGSKKEMYCWNGKRT